ncbi:MAG TPA: amino acid ABC transporter permease [Anaerolineae bacterium]|nr:amino acid ABC transporter permease [Anaerolineae bacterium]
MSTTTEEKNNQPYASINNIFRRIDSLWLLVVAVLLIIVLLIILKPDPFMRILVYAKDGILVTIYTTLLSFALVLILGLFGGLGRISHVPFIRRIASLYIEIVRGVPLLVQLIFWYFAFPSIIQDVGTALNKPALINYKANPLAMAILGLTFCYGAYMSEVYRAGIESIPKGQMEAARSLGMNYFQAMRHIILPQAVRVVLPPIGNEFITLLKDSSLVSVVAVADLTRRGREFMAANFIPVQTWLMVGLLYLVLTLVSARVVRWLETKSRYER